MIFLKLLGISLTKIYRRSFRLTRDEDREFFNIVSDILYTAEVQRLKNFIQHGSVTTYEHVVSVAFISYIFCKRLDLNYIPATRAALLHDLVNYDWHEKDASHRLHGFRHPGFALENARRITTLSPLEEDIILRHMWPLTAIPPRYKESYVVTAADKFCASVESLARIKFLSEVFGLV